MAWLKVDDRVRTHPKVVKAGPAAAWLWFCGICYCREHLTDGFIGGGMVPSLSPGLTNSKALATKLVDAGLWHVDSDGYRVHDFLDWNPARASVLQKRADDLDRKKNKPRRDSTPIPAGTIDGIHADSTATRDARAVAPPGSGSSGSGSSGGAGGPRPFDRQHRNHINGFCDWVCLPEFVFNEFVGRCAGVGIVDAWAKNIRRQWEGRDIGDNLKFWRDRWAERPTTDRKDAALERRGDAFLEKVRAIEAGQ